VNLDQLIAQLKRLASTLTIGQILTLVGVLFAVVGLVVGSAYWVNTPSYTLLYSDLDAESASAVVTQLKNAKVPYVLDENGRSVRVASDRIDELRLDMASQGLPATGRVGFEIFDRTAFGTTEFLEHVNYRRGLEGELARTISTISEVSSARVHIALAKDSLFTGDAQPAKASVVLKLRNNRPLAASTIAGIAGLVAGSVESLRPEAVVIVDTFGRPLSRTDMDREEIDSGVHIDDQRRVEQDLTTKVIALLEPVVGPGHVRVNVSARLSSNSEEQTEERWDPTTVLRSRQSMTDVGSQASSQGIAGARANAPPNASTTPPAPTPTTAPPQVGKSSETANYEVSKLTRHTIAPSGQLARLSVAVILDDERTVTKDTEGKVQTTSKPREATDIERIKGLVSAAVGLDAARGDQLTVENIAFEEPPVEEDVPAPSGWRQYTPQLTPELGMQALRTVGVIALALVAIFVVLRPMARAALGNPLPKAAKAVAGVAAAPAPASFAQPGGRTVADLEGDIEAELDANEIPKTGALRLPALTKRISKKADEHPEAVAKLVRSWLTEQQS
jgi:flagellar M-ring protein FliF